MPNRRVQFTYDASQIKDPIIYQLGRQFDVITNIRRADVSEDRGWVILEIEGSEESIDRGLEWVMSYGVRVDPVLWDVVEG